MAGEIAPGTWFQLLDDEMERLQPCGTQFLTGLRLDRIEDGAIVATEVKSGKERRIPADSVVLSLGVRPDNTLLNTLQERLPRVYAVGDALSSGTIADAVHSAYTVCMNIH